jgi:hypothetical protein
MNQDMNTQVREYTEFFQGGIEPVEMEEILERRIGDGPVRPVGPVRSTHRRGWVTAAIAAAVVLIVLGTAGFLASGTAPDVTGDSPSSSQQPAVILGVEDDASPTSTAPVSVDVPGTVAVPPLSAVPLPVDWELATGTAPDWLQYGVAPVVSNGSSFLGVHGKDGDAKLVRSVDGVRWVEVTSPIPDLDYAMEVPIVAGSHYFMAAQRDGGQCSTGDEPACEVHVSSDGLQWESQPSTLEDSFLTQWVWRVKNPDAVLLGQPPYLQHLDAFGTVIMEFDDRLVAIGVEHYLGHVVGAFESTELGTWTRIDPPPRFVEIMTEEYNDAGWQSMWRCEFAARDGQAMALIAADNKYELWNTTDGVNWKQLPDPPTGIEAEGRGRCIKAVDSGWIIGPGGGPGVEIGVATSPVRTAPGSLIYSEDGTSWSNVDFDASIANFTGLLETADNTIFLMDLDTGKTLVGTINNQ